MTPGDRIRSTLAFLALAASGVFADSPPPPDVSESSMPRMITQMQSGETHLTPSVMTEEGKLGRWVGLETASISSRYRHIESFSAMTTASNIQDQIAFRGQLKLDPGGRFTLHAGLFTGGSFSSGWNSSGAGTGAAQPNVFLKQLYLSAGIAKGVDGAYGGLEIARGESTEITSYDNDGYIVGGRIRIRRADRVFFDEISVTQGYLGDLTRPSVFPRFLHLSRSNYYQLLAAKSVGRVRFSTDYTSESSVRTIRQGVSVLARGLRVVDVLHFEQYERSNHGVGYGFSTYGEKKLFSRISAGSGYAQLDRPGLYSDRFGPGKRLFWNTHVALGPEWSFMFLATHALSGQPAGQARTRFDVALGYNLLACVRETGWFH